MIGDFTPGKTVRLRFNTHKADGTPITLAGTPAVSVYKGSTTQSTAGVTLTVDYDALTGLHDVVVDTSADGTFYAAGNDFNVVITAGTVDSISVVGTIVGGFSLSNRSHLRPTTADRTLDVSAGGEAGVDWANVGGPTTVLNLSGTTVKTATDVETDTQDIQARLPAALVAGRIDASVGALASGVITATSIAADAITDAKVAADVTIASVTGAVGSVTGNVGGNVVGSVGSVVGAVGSVTAGVTVTTNNDKNSYRLSATGVDDIWDEAQAGHATAGTFGKFLDASVSGVSTGGVSAADIADAVWDEQRSGHVAAGSFGEGVASVQGNLTGSVGSVTGAVGSVTGAVGSVTGNVGGNVVGTVASVVGNVGGNVVGSVASVAATVNVSALSIGLIQSGLATSLAQTAIGTNVTAIKAKTDNLPAAPASTGDVTAATAAATTAGTEATAAKTAAQAVKLVTDKLDTAMALDGSVYRFTANSLELAPTGGGSGGGFTGDRAVTFHFEDADGEPVGGAIFTVRGVGTAQSDAEGVATVSLFDGAATVAVAPAGGLLWADTDITVDADGTDFTFTAAGSAVGTPDDPAMTRLYTTMRRGDGTAAMGATLQARLVQPAGGDSYPRKPFTTNSSAGNGILTHDLPTGGLYEFRRDGGEWVQVKVGAGPTQSLPAVLGDVSEA